MILILVFHDVVAVRTNRLVLRKLSYCVISERLATKKHLKVSPDMKKSRANIMQQ